MSDPASLRHHVPGIHPIGLAVYQLGDNGTARALLKSWPLTP